MSSDQLRNDDGHVLAQLLNLVFQVRILQMATPKIRARRGEFANQHTCGEYGDWPFEHTSPRARTSARGCSCENGYVNRVSRRARSQCAASAAAS
jgi:hypothetical protein